MTKWLRRIRGALGMGLTWAFAWACTGVLIGVASIVFPALPWDAFFRIFDAPLPALAVPGFFGGVFYSVVLGIAGRRRRFDELSLPRVAAWGAVGGLMLSLFPAAMVLLGLATPAGGIAGLWRFTALIAGPVTLLSSGSASASLLLARKAESRALLESGEGAADHALSAGDKRALPGSGDRLKG